MPDATKVSVGKPNTTGACYRAPIGTTLPTTASETLNVAFVSLGYIGEDGLKNANSPESDSVKAWGGDTVATFQKGKEDKFGFELIEALNVDVLKTIYGDSNVTGTLATGITVNAKSEEATEYSWVFDIILKGSVLKRIVVPCAKITDVGEVTYADENLVGYDTEITATPDASGNTHHEYIKSPSASSGSTQTTGD